MPSEISEKHTSMEYLQEVFSSWGPEWDLTKPLAWGFWFEHSEPCRLEASVEKLEKYGVQFVSIDLADKESSEEPDVFLLRMEEARVHTKKSLENRHNEFHVFASNEGIDSYGGISVTQIRKTVA